MSFFCITALYHRFPKQPLPRVLLSSTPFSRPCLESSSSFQIQFSHELLRTKKFLTLFIHIPYPYPNRSLSCDIFYLFYLNASKTLNLATTLPSVRPDPRDRKMRALGSAGHLPSMAFLTYLCGTQLQRSLSHTVVSVVTGRYRGQSQEHVPDDGTGPKAGSSIVCSGNGKW